MDTSFFSDLKKLKDFETNIKLNIENELKHQKKIDPNDYINKLHFNYPTESKVENVLKVFQDSLAIDEKPIKKQTKLNSNNKPIHFGTGNVNGGFSKDKKDKKESKEKKEYPKNNKETAAKNFPQTQDLSNKKLDNMTNYKPIIVSYLTLLKLARKGTRK